MIILEGGKYVSEHMCVCVWKKSFFFFFFFFFFGGGVISLLVFYIKQLSCTVVGNAGRCPIPKISMVMLIFVKLNHNV